MIADTVGSPRMGGRRGVIPERKGGELKLLLREGWLKGPQQ